jgi:hypothetical protein
MDYAHDLSYQMELIGSDDARAAKVSMALSLMAERSEVDPVTAARLASVLRLLDKARLRRDKANELRGRYSL